MIAPLRRHESGEPAPLRVVLAANQNYFLGLMVTAASVAVTTDSKTQLELCVLDGGLAAKSWARLESLVRRLHPKTQLIRLHIDESVVRGIRGDGKKSPMTYARLLLPQFLTSGRAVYLDSDCLVLGDLTALSRAEIGESCCGAIQDPITRYLADDTPPSYASESNRQQPYFNAGVMLIDLDRWRQQQISERTLDFLRGHGDDCRFWDQTALNQVLVRKWESLPPNWNFPSNQFDCRTASAVQVIHYLCNEKPWEGDPGGDAHALWREFAGTLAGVRRSELSWMIPRDRLKRGVADQMAPVIAALFSVKARASRIAGTPQAQTAASWAAHYWTERQAARPQRREAHHRLQQYLFQQRCSWQELARTRG